MHAAVKGWAQLGWWLAFPRNWISPSVAAPSQPGVHNISVKFKAAKKHQEIFGRASLTTDPQHPKSSLLFLCIAISDLLQDSRAEQHSSHIASVLAVCLSLQLLLGKALWRQTVLGAEGSIPTSLGLGELGHTSLHFPVHKVDWEPPSCSHGHFTGDEGTATTQNTCVTVQWRLSENRENPSEDDLFSASCYLQPALHVVLQSCHEVLWKRQR